MILIDLVGCKVYSETQCGLRGVIEIRMEKDGEYYKITSGLGRLKIEKLQEP